MRYSTLLAPLALLAVPATAEAADCQPAFVDRDQSLTINGVEIEAGGRAVENFQIRIHNTAASGGAPANAAAAAPGATGDLPCQATIRMARLMPSAQPDFPPYLLRASGSRRVEVLANAAAGGTVDSDIVVAAAPSGQQGRAIPFQIGVPTEWGLRAGTYVERLQLLLVDRNGNIADRSTLTINVVIPPAVSLRLIGAVIGGESRGPAQIDLGNLSNSRETRSPRFGALILSTAPYVVRFSSANRGNLLHEQGRALIPYRLYFDGAPVDLAGSTEIPYLDPTPRGGDRRAMSIVVPPVVALAGRYSDRITVTVSAL